MTMVLVDDLGVDGDVVGKDGGVDVVIDENGDVVVDGDEIPPRLLLRLLPMFLQRGDWDACKQPLRRCGSPRNDTEIGWDDVIVCREC